MIFEFFTPGIPLILKKHEVVDIDSETDWKNAEEIYVKLNN